MIKRAISNVLRIAGIRSATDEQFIEPVEFSNADRDVLRLVLDNRLTMASPQRVIATINACKHAVSAGIDGDFVECGVWRGGNSIAAALTLANYGSDKQVWLFDTFAGMTEPGGEDTTSYSRESAEERFRKARKGDHSEWCFASLGDVRTNMLKARVDMTKVRFVAGDVRETLLDENNLPKAIAVLRLDTDFYDSTKMELETLYPRLSSGGSFLIDDFGHWEGARKAIEEYLERVPARSRPLLHFTDYTGRMGVKP